MASGVCRYHPAVYLWKRRYLGSAVFEFARVSARSCSAVKEFPQVLHLHLAFGLAMIPSLGLPRPLSLGRKAITRSPPHSRHCRLVMVYCYSNAEDFSGHKCTLFDVEQFLRRRVKNQVCSKLNTF